ncbi:DnaJ protein ERDJ3B [Diplonema papillatum]|nr:DnaJ protein ERDJ3B [Diplonema papillatum]
MCEPRVLLHGLTQSKDMNGEICPVRARKTENGYEYLTVELGRKCFRVNKLNTTPVHDVVGRRRTGDVFGMKVSEQLVISFVKPGSLADRMHLKSGCIIHEVNGIRTADRASFLEAMDKAETESTVRLSFTHPADDDDGERVLRLLTAMLTLALICVGIYVYLHVTLYDTTGFFEGQYHQAGVAKVPTLPDYYAVLGLQGSRDITAGEIKSSFRKLSQKYHPDKSGERETYEKIRQAYDVLSNPRRRKMYDVLGINEEVLPNLVPDHKGADDVYTLKIRLEDVYSGATHVAGVPKNRLSGLSRVRDCQECLQQPPQIRLVNFMGHMVRQSMAPDCRVQCSSRGATTAVEQELEIVVPPGVPEGEAIVFVMESHEFVDRLPGDVVFVVESAAHPLFKRRGSDLYMNVRVSVVEAVTGFHRQFTHLDGHSFEVKSADPTEHGTVLRLEGKGLPAYREDAAGDLHVSIEVEFPSALTDSQKSSLESLLAEVV